MEVCAASVQGAVVPSSDYAFAGRSNAHALALSVCVLPDIAVCKLMEPSVARHTRFYQLQPSLQPLRVVRRRFGGGSSRVESVF